MVNIAHYIPVFPFLAFLINIFWGKRLSNLSALVSVVACALSFIFSVMVFQSYGQGQGSYILGTWLTLNGAPLKFGVIVDSLSVMMLLVVTLIATLIKVYSISYMKGDPRYSRYFAYISLFTSSMLGLILADNLVLLYIFWEGVGLCSYLLISFWFEKPAAARAGLKAFITTRIGDTGLLLGIFILFFQTKTLRFDELAHAPGNEWMMALAALLIFLGAVGKSAQFPLHVWLPDAMEGPTTVSALIHAATMVAAGVYLVARTYVLFIAHPLCCEVVAIVGGISALMAATMAMTNNDIKRILAYSTMSQLGLMMLGLGVGGYSAGTFHLMTHAFFKALLFLCAGSVIHAVHTQDIQKMGGLFSKMKVTGTTFILGALALAGIPPLAGFWSKDEILSQAYHGHPVLFAVAALTSLLTSFYMARLIFLVLFGKPRQESHAHESPLTMTIPLIILSFFAVTIGLIGSPFMQHAFQKFIMLGALGAQHAQESGLAVMILSTIISLAGILLAYVVYVRGAKILPQGVRVLFSPLYKLAANKYYIDEIYEALFIQPFLKLCRGSNQFDGSVVDGLVNKTANFVQWSAGLLRRLQTGLIQNYLLVLIIGAAILIVSLKGL